jgi:arginine deiminase
MDPLSLTASLIAIGTAATTALQISKSLYDFARAYKSAGEEIENFALDLRSFASVVQLGQDSLDRHRKNAPFSQVIRYIESLDVLNQLASQSSRTTTNIERVWQQTQSLQTDTLVTKVKWMAKKSEVRRLKPDMESLKSSLHLVMAAVTMEALQQSGSRDLQDEM